jgi:hypothetical protein
MNDEADRWVEFQQLDVVIDERTIPQSGWGRMRFDTRLWTGPLYCNLTVLDRWQVRNVLIVPPGRGCAMPTPDEPDSPIWMAIPLGTADGLHLDNITYGLSFTPQVLLEPPSSLQTAPVTPFTYTIHHDFVGTPVPYYPPKPIGGVFFTKGVPHGHPEIHNHPCGLNECVPNAVRLALEYLYTEYNLDQKGLACADFELAALKVALKWTPDKGCANGQGDKAGFGRP